MSPEALNMSFCNVSSFVSLSFFQPRKNKMGHSFSSPTSASSTICPELEKPSNGEFQLALDAKAFEFHMSGAKTVRVTKLYVDGQWGDTEGIYGPQDEYNDAYVKINPNTKGGFSIEVKPLKEISFLYSKTRTAATLLCRKGTSVAVYRVINFRQEVKKVGRYEIQNTRSFFVLCGDEYVLMISLPEDEVGRAHAYAPAALPTYGLSVGQMFAGVQQQHR